MLNPIAIAYKRLSGLDIAAISPTGDVHRYCSLSPNRRTELTDLTQGPWIVRNDSPHILRLDARSGNDYLHIRTLCPSEHWRFNWPYDKYALTATLEISAQVLPLSSMDSDAHLQQARALNLNRTESLFFHYMAGARTSCSRVPVGISKTPDFTITLAEKIVPIELKAFERNGEEQEDAKLLSSRGYSHARSGEIGHRLAKVVNSARSQLRSFLEQHGDGPAILAVIDPCGLGHASLQEIAAVLEGHMVVQLATGSRSHIGAFRKENRRRAPHDRNEILSAIAVLNLMAKEGPALVWGAKHNCESIVANLVVYHNPHAMHPLSPHVFARSGFPQYSFGTRVDSALQAFA